jgi:hypothetical protein
MVEKNSTAAVGAPYSFRADDGIVLIYKPSTSGGVLKLNY